MALTAVLTAAVLWLAATHRLSLYINPRYIVFTSVMTSISLAAFLAAAVMRHHDERPRKARASTVVAGACAGVLALALLLIQPAALTSGTALQRGINSGGLDLTTATNVTAFGSADYAHFTIQEWASILSQVNSAAFFQGKTARLIGFVAPAGQNDPDVFYVSRFVITCCAIDAQPVGVPVYEPGWQQSYPANSWVDLRGGFMPNPNKQSGTSVLLKPAAIVKIPEPQDPYVH